jgi:hypothetical protein
MLETQTTAGLQSPECLTLRVRSRNGLDRTVRVRTRRLTIGSGEDCNLRLRSAGVEGLQCEIRRSGETVTAHRLSPHTLLNGREFDEASLAPGDVLRVGPVELTVVQTGVADPWETTAPAPEAPAPPAAPTRPTTAPEANFVATEERQREECCGQSPPAARGNRLDALEELCSTLQKDQERARSQLAQLEAYTALLDSQVAALGAQPAPGPPQPQASHEKSQEGIAARLDGVALSLADVDQKRKAMEQQWGACLRELKALAQSQSEHRDEVNRRLEEIRGQVDMDAQREWRKESQEQAANWKRVCERVESQLARLQLGEAGLAELGRQVRSELEESRGLSRQQREEWESWLKAAGAERQEGKSRLAALQETTARWEESVGQRCREADRALEELRTGQAALLEERARWQAEWRRLAEMLDALAAAGAVEPARDEPPGAGAAEASTVARVVAGQSRRDVEGTGEVSVAEAGDRVAADEVAPSGLAPSDAPSLPDVAPGDVESEEMRRKIREAFGLPLDAVESIEPSEEEEVGAQTGVASDLPPQHALPAADAPLEPAAAAEPEVPWKGLDDAPAEKDSGAPRNPADSDAPCDEAATEDTVTRDTAAARVAATAAEPPLPAEGHDESIESYMSRLLARARTSPAENAGPPAGDEEQAEASPAAKAPPTPAPIPPETEQYRPRATAPEVSADIAAMRELANKNARQAIDTHDKGRLKAKARMKLGLTVATLLAAVGVTWFLGSMGTVAYLVAIGCLLGAVIFGVQYLVLVSKITAREEEEEEELAKGPRPGQGSDEEPPAFEE